MGREQTGPPNGRGAGARRAGSGQDLQTGERWWDRRDFSIVSQDEGEENEMGGEEMGKEKC